MYKLCLNTIEEQFPENKSRVLVVTGYHSDVIEFDSGEIQYVNIDGKEYAALNDNILDVSDLWADAESLLEVQTIMHRISKYAGSVKNELFNAYVKSAKPNVWLIENADEWLEMQLLAMCNENTVLAESIYINKEMFLLKNIVIKNVSRKGNNLELLVHVDSAFPMENAVVEPNVDFQKDENDDTNKEEVAYVNPTNSVQHEQIEFSQTWRILHNFDADAKVTLTVDAYDNGGTYYSAPDKCNVCGNNCIEVVFRVPTKGTLTIVEMAN